MAKDRFGKEVTDTEVREALAAAVAKELEPVAEPLPHRARFRPQVVLVCGVNGTGKTTTIGKLANQAVGAASRWCWPPATPSAPPRSSSSRSGASATACR